MIELTTWFRRAIWFLAFTSATTLSPGLFFVAAALGLVFELVYNVTNARRYWDTMVGYDGHDTGYDGHDKGNINYVDDYDKNDKDYDKIEYEYDYPTNAYPISRTMQQSFNPRLFYRPQAPIRRFSFQPARKFVGSPSVTQLRLGYGSPHNNIYRNTWLRDRYSAARRSDTDTSATEEQETNIRLEPKPSNKMLNWRYLLGLPPWFLKE